MTPLGEQSPDNQLAGGNRQNDDLRVAAEESFDKASINRQHGHLTVEMIHLRVGEYRVRIEQTGSQKEVCDIDVLEYKRSQNPCDEAQKRDLKEALTHGLTRAEKLIVVLYYYEEMTMKEIGATLGLSESRVSQMHSSIIARLKAGTGSEITL